jgi:hypothetical protein
MAVVLRRLTGRRPAAIEPGAWLLFSLGCILTVDLAVALLPAGFPVRRESLQIGGTCLALALPTLSRRMPGRWKALLALLTLLAAAQLVVLLGALSLEVELARASLARFRIIRAGVGLVMLAAVTLLDYRAHRRHGWLHLVGIAAMAVWLVMLFS